MYTEFAYSNLTSLPKLRIRVVSVALKSNRVLPSFSVLHTFFGRPIANVRDSAIARRSHYALLGHITDDALFPNDH